VTEQGERGRTGQTGETGVRGRTGVAGAAGATGQTGAAGEHGERGTAGSQGRRGADGTAMTNRRMLVIFGVVVVAFFGTALRTEINQREIRQNAARIEQELRADCPFKLDVATLPAAAIRDGQKPSTALIKLARSARAAFIGKGCPQAINPDTGQPFGQPPEVQTK
jgi:hypothetical protein